MLTLSACATMPKWVKSNISYETADFIYAVGYSPPTLFRKDAEENAKNNAIIELSKYIEVNVKSFTASYLDKSGSKNIKDGFLNISQETVNRTISKIETVSVWYDEKGIRGEKGAAFALVRIKKSYLTKK